HDCVGEHLRRLRPSGAPGKCLKRTAQRGDRCLGVVAGAVTLREPTGTVVGKPGVVSVILPTRIFSGKSMPIFGITASSALPPLGLPNISSQVAPGDIPPAAPPAAWSTCANTVR